MIAAILIFLLAVGSHATLLETLICDTNITMQGSNVPDDSPVITPNWQMSATKIPVTFTLSSTDLQTQYYVQIDTATVTATGYDGDTQVGKVQTWNKLLAGSAIAQEPDAFTGCGDVIGCDGFMISTVPMLALFPSNLTNIIFECILKYYNNGTASSQSGGFSVMTAPPSTSTLIGTSSLVSVNLTATKALLDQAFNPSTSSSTTLSTGAIIGIAFGAVAFVVLLYVFWMKLKHDNAEQNPRKANGTEMGKSSFSAHYRNAHSQTTGRFVKMG